MTARAARWFSLGCMLSFPGSFIFAFGMYHEVVRVGAFWTVNAIAFLCILRAAWLHGTESSE